MFSSEKLKALTGQKTQTGLSLMFNTDETNWHLTKILGIDNQDWLKHLKTSQRWNKPDILGFNDDEALTKGKDGFESGLGDKKRQDMLGNGGQAIV